MKNTMRFQKIGGSRQLVLDKAENLEQIPVLDEALWAVTAIPVDSVIMDREFLTFLDADGNGRIRPEELKNAVKWLTGVLNDYSGIDEASGTLRLSALNPDHPDADMLRASALLALNNLGAEDKTQITLSQVRDKKSIIAAGNNNGDGIITPANTEDPAVAQCISDIITCCGSKQDLSGEPGIDEAILNTFREEGSAHLEWLKTGREEDNSSPYGERAADFYALYAAIREKINEFYTFCGGLADDSADSRFGPLQKVDPLNVDEMGNFIRKAPVAMPTASGLLSVKKWMNPLWKTTVLNFLTMAKELNMVESDELLTEPEWRNIEKSFVVRSGWDARKSNDKFDSLDIPTLEAYLAESNITALREMIAADLSVAKEIAACELLKKLILYQQNMLRFVNNFICLSDLFNPQQLSVIQPGRLILDGRYFTLLSNVSNLAEHKKIIARSNICVMYLELNTGKGTEAKKQTMAAAITSGSMRNIFIGKTGVFLTGDGIEWDAKVIDLIQQPVSFSEALQMPFFKLGEFAGKQADKFFSTKSKNVETDITKQVTDAANQKVPPQSPVQPPAQTPAVSGSMMLMGGGIGLAAIGSSVAFIAKSLQNISILNVLAVLLGIIVIFGGPLVVISLVKLFRRDLSRFLEAEGCAVNLRMRLSHRMGKIFSFRPQFPAARFNGLDLVDAFSGKKPHGKMLIWLIIILIAAVTAGGIFWIRIGCHQREMLPATPIRPAQSASTEPAATPAAMAPAPQDSISGAKK